MTTHPDTQSRTFANGVDHDRMLRRALRKALATTDSEPVGEPWRKGYAAGHQHGHLDGLRKAMVRRWSWYLVGMAWGATLTYLSIRLGILAGGG